MPTSQRGTGPDLIARLLAAPQAFGFAQAVTILLRWLEEQGVPPAQALRAHLRFENSLRLGFAPSEIEDLRVLAGGAAGSGTGSEPGNSSGAALPQFVIVPGFMGLLGVQGALPLHYTERIGQWQSVHADAAPRAFLDLLSGRMLALYYEAWRKHRVDHAAASRPDRFMPRLLALAGITGEASGMGHAGTPDAALAYFAGMLQQRPRSAPVLQALLAGYFDVPVTLEETVGHWSRLDAQEQGALGAGAVLGENTMLGARSWRPDLRARLRIGPLSRARFERFLPSGDMAAALARMLTLFGVPGIDFEVQLVLRAGEVAPSQLGGAAAVGSPVRLGRTSFLVTGPADSDRADMRYLVRRMAALPARRRRPAP